MVQREAYQGPTEAIFLSIEGKEIRIYEHYEVSISVFRQPAAFSLRVGWSETLNELHRMCQPGKHFELRIGPVAPDSDKPRTVIQSGRIDRRSVPSATATSLEVSGRDYSAQLFDSYVLEEQAFAEATYFELTRKALDAVGLTADKGHRLTADNHANRKAITGATRAPAPVTQLVEETPTGATSGAGKVVYNTLKATLGTRWYDFLQKQYKLAGLFLWCTGNGEFFLGRPNPNQVAVYRIIRKRGLTRSAVNAVDAHYDDDTTMRHSTAIVYGRAGGTKGGIRKVRGEAQDQEMLAYGFDKPVVIHDDDVKTPQEAEYVARRMLAEERRASWKLEYIVAGHVVPSNFSSNGFAVWGPDLVCAVDDDELVIHKDYYVETVTFSRNPKTTTRISLMRKQDIAYLAEVAP